LRLRQGARRRIGADKTWRRVIDGHLVFPVGGHQARAREQHQQQEAGHDGKRRHRHAVGPQAAPGQRPQAG
jgi:hypothetical protein